MHVPVSSGEIVEAILHIRHLFDQVRPSDEPEVRASERRKAATKELLSNLPRISEHPTLRTLLEIADIFSLTLEGAHRLFGYKLQDLWQWDIHLNGARTHIIESYPFARDLSIELPARMAPTGAFAVDALLSDLVLEWQTGIPLRAIEEAGWEQPGAYYVRVGTEDSLGSSIPPGALALVEPISESERALPNPRHIYLLQFPNGYRCSHCVVTRGKLRPFTSGRTYLGREEFGYPGSVRIAGKIRMFALELPLPESSPLSLPFSSRGGELILPWEHKMRDRLFATKHRRFQRSKDEEALVQEILREALHTKLSPRSERRYRRPTASEPHVNALIHLALAHTARYSDALRTGGSWRSDRGRFSLEVLLRARSFEEALADRHDLQVPTPREIWEALRKEYGGWPSLLSVKFPKLRQWENRIVRLARGTQIAGLAPTIGPGAFLLLDETSSTPDPRIEREKSGWSRPIYALRRIDEVICGYLEKSGDRYALVSDANGAVKADFGVRDLSRISRVAGVAVPV